MHRSICSTGLLAASLHDSGTLQKRDQQMRIGLFIPCYIDAFFPEVAIATLELLERFGHDVVYPRDQTCCGQPMANSGFNADCAATEALFVRNFSGFDYVVAPSGSCVHHVRSNFDAIEQTPEVKEVRARTLSWSSFYTTSKTQMPFRGQNFRIGSGCTTAAARCGNSSTPRHLNCTSRSFPSRWIS
jgi:Cysteine-rich domain